MDFKPDSPARHASTHLEPEPTGFSPLSLLYGLAAALAVCIYFYGLSSEYIPKNGDESVYMQIARVTAASGHWLPLETQIPGTRNIKPPMLFWQGIVSTTVAGEWTPFNLRAVNVLYTLLTAMLAGLLARKYSGSRGTGVMAALTYLAFFDTYRYGRPFLTNAPETFWLFLVWFLVLYFDRAARQSRFMPLLLGVVAGIGLWYKSFAVLTPVWIALALWFARERQWSLKAFVLKDAYKLVVIGAVAVGLFGCWFVLDPNPAAIWSDFIIKENASKFDSSGSSYAMRFIWGGSSIWTMLLGAPVNAGLLFFPIAALMVTALKDRNALSRDQKTLWLWVVVMIVFYSIPTQRSVRYLLTAMPALAILLALGWDRLARGWFIATLALSALLLTFLGYESLALQATLQTLPGATTYPWVYWLMLIGATAFCVTAIRIADLTRPGAPIAALLVFLGMSSFLIPLDGASGHFSASAVQASAGRSVWVPVQVDGEDEPYRFLLPQAKIQPYRQANGLDAEALAHHYALFTVRSELKEPGCFDCRVLGERLVLKGRLNQHDVLEILKGRIFKTLILKESLVESRIKDALRAG